MVENVLAALFIHEAFLYAIRGVQDSDAPVLGLIATGMQPLHKGRPLHAHPGGAGRFVLFRVPDGLQPDHIAFISLEPPAGILDR